MTIPCKFLDCSEVVNINNVENFHKMKVTCINANFDSADYSGRMGWARIDARPTIPLARGNTATALQPNQPCVTPRRAASVAQRAVFVERTRPIQTITPVCSRARAAKRFLYFTGNRVELPWLDPRDRATDAVGISG